MFTATTTYKAFSQNRLGRFLSPDPYGQFYSAYTGMGNNPVNLVDPSGGTAINYTFTSETIEVNDWYEILNWGQDWESPFVFGPTGGVSGGGNGGSTGPGCGSGGGSGVSNPNGRLSGPPPDPDGDEEETKTVPRGEPNEYKTEAMSPAIPIGYQILEITFATSAALVGTVAVLVVFTSSDTRPPEPLPEPDVVDELIMISLAKITRDLITGNEHYPGPWTEERPKDYIKPIKLHDNTITIPSGSGKPIIDFIVQLAGGIALIKTFYDATEVEPVDTTQNNSVEPDVFYYEKK